MKRYDVIIPEGAPDPMLPSKDGQWVQYAQVVRIVKQYGYRERLVETGAMWRVSQPFRSRKSIGMMLVG